RRRRRYGIAFALAAIIAVPAFLKTGEYLSRERLLQNNTGTVDLVLVPFDWAGNAAIPSGIAPVQHLSVALYGAKTDQLDQPGEPLPGDVTGISAAADFGAFRTQRIRAPGGTVFLRIDGRGRPGEACAPSWIRIQAFPGYLTDHIQRFTLWVPTCRATRADTVIVEAGSFVYGGPGEPPSKYYGEPDYTEPEQIVPLPEFAIDRTEVSNAAFAPFGRLEKITGYPAPVYPVFTDPHHPHDGEPGYPVTYVDAYEAAAYCAYMGKRLPSEFQWTKAARGGLQIDGKPNPWPRRLYPWGDVSRDECVNLDGIGDGYIWTAPVDAFACGASPYGILQLAGNAQEWIARDGQTDRHNPLYVMRGGSIDSASTLDHTTTIFRNRRPARAFAFSNGLRCVVDTDDPPASNP
ncbi:MAG: SUMF1/EgtB/PvdO family nonheme iron enzyme, partial [Kofleriaceae bacterium]